MKACLKSAVHLPYVNFKTIGDYLILVCYYLKLLHVPKNEMRTFIREFERITGKYKASVSPAVSSIVIHPDLASRIETLKNFV